MKSSESLGAQIHRLEKPELILIRVGQHLFCWWRNDGRRDRALEASFESVWDLKRQIRVSKAQLRILTSHRRKAGVLQPN
jgi:hypothetical protein